jgi:hypothetical protein
MDLKLSQDVLDVSAEGTLRHAKLLRNVIGFHSPYKKVENLSLASSQGSQRHVMTCSMTLR